MKIAFFDTHVFEKEFYVKVNNQYKHTIDFLDVRLNEKTASIAAGADAVCSFVNDKIDEKCIQVLKKIGIKLIALRSAGYNHVDVPAAKRAGITVVRVPGYSPYAIAEFTVGLLLTLNRKIHRAHIRVRENNFSLDGLVGFDLHGKTVGVIGAGKIGCIFAKIMAAFGCHVLVNDILKDKDLENHDGIVYTNLHDLCQRSHIISLHVPLTPQTHHLVCENLIADMMDGVFILNTGRGALIDAKALINNLKSGKIGGAALDVYEEEEGIFFHDLSQSILQDDNLARLLTFPNVLLTSHQAFLTKEALENIASTTLESVTEFESMKKMSPFKEITL
jgi:D-lactate dehydrogenase